MKKGERRKAKNKRRRERQKTRRKLSASQRRVSLLEMTQQREITSTDESIRDQRESIALANKALSSRWPIPAQTKINLVASLEALINGSQSEPVRIAAANTLARLEGQNQRDEISERGYIPPESDQDPDAIRLEYEDDWFGNSPSGADRNKNADAVDALMVEAAKYQSHLEGTAETKDEPIPETTKVKSNGKPSNGKPSNGKPAKSKTSQCQGCDDPNCDDCFEDPF